MDARTYYETFGREESQRIAKVIGITWDLYRQYIYGRSPGPKNAWRMVWASNYKMSLEELIRPPEGETASHYQYRRA